MKNNKLVVRSQVGPTEVKKENPWDKFARMVKENNSVVQYNMHVLSMEVKGLVSVVR